MDSLHISSQDRRVQFNKSINVKPIPSRNLPIKRHYYQNYGLSNITTTTRMNRKPQLSRSLSASNQQDTNLRQEIIDHHYNDQYTVLYSIPINSKWQIIPNANQGNFRHGQHSNNSIQSSNLSDQIRKNQKAYFDGHKNKQTVPKELVSLCNQHIRRKSMMVKVNHPTDLSHTKSRSRSIDTDEKPQQNSNQSTRHHSQTNSQPVILPPAIKIDYAGDHNDKDQQKQLSESLPLPISRRSQRFKPFRPRTTSELNILTQFKSTAPVKYSWYYKPC